MGLREPFPASWQGLIMCGFMNTLAVSCLETALETVLTCPLALTSFLSCPAHGWALSSLFFLVLCPVTSPSLCVHCCPLQKEPSLATAASNSDQQAYAYHAEGNFLDPSSPFGKTPAVILTLGPMTSPATSFQRGLWYQMWLSSSEVGFDSHQKVMDCHQNKIAAVIPVGACCLTGG